MDEKMYQALLGLRVVFQSVAGRCQHCHGEMFACDECQSDGAEFLGHIADLLTSLVIDPDERLLILLELTPRLNPPLEFD